MAALVGAILVGLFVVTIPWGIHNIPEGHVGVYFRGGALLQVRFPSRCLFTSAHHFSGCLNASSCSCIVCLTGDYRAGVSLLFAISDGLPHGPNYHANRQGPLGDLRSHDPECQLDVCLLSSVCFCRVRPLFLVKPQVVDIPCGTSGGVMIYFDKIEVVNRLKKEGVYDTIKNYRYLQQNNNS